MQSSSLGVRPLRGPAGRQPPPLTWMPSGPCDGPLLPEQGKRRAAVRPLGQYPPRPEASPGLRSKKDGEPPLPLREVSRVLKTNRRRSLS